MTELSTTPTSPWRTIVDLVGHLFDRIISTIGGFVLAAGCQNAEVMTTTPPPTPIERVATVVADASVPEDAPGPIGEFNITFYYVIGEDEVVPKKPKEVAVAVAAAGSSDDTLAAAITPPDLVTVYKKEGCEPIAEVSREFATQLGIQGTGKLRDGRVLNIWGQCNCGRSPCFKVTENQWGTAGSGHPLQPFRTVAVDPKVVKIGTLLHVPLLEGRLMPGRAPFGGFVHDGCVVADDTGGGIDGNQLDLFVGRKGYFLGLSGSGGSHAWARHVPVYDGTNICERKGRKVGRKSGAI